MGEEAGVRDHAVVGPHGLPVDVPAALEHLERLDHAERGVRRAPRAVASPGRSSAGTRAGSRRAERGLGVLHDPPRLGQVEEDAVEVVDLDAVVDVAHLDRRAGRRGRGSSRRCGGRGRRSRRAARSRGRGPAGPIARSNVIVSAPEPTPDSSTFAPGNTSASMRIGPRSFG